jgi:hypothetical protein
MLILIKWFVKQYFALLSGVLVGSVVSTLVCFVLLTDSTDIQRIEQVIKLLKDCEE